MTLEKIHIARYGRADKKPFCVREINNFLFYNNIEDNKEQSGVRIDMKPYL